MENIGDYYWILIAIAAAASFFGKSKKKTVSQNPQPAETPPQDWEDILGELLGRKKPEPQPVVQPVAPAVERKISRPEIKTQKPVYKPIVIPVDETDADGEGIISIKSGEMEEDTGGFSLDDISSEAGEWRRVFVYNEIFNRKY